LSNYAIRYSDSQEQKDSLAVKGIFDELRVEYDSLADKEIIILGRYSRDIDRLIEDPSILSVSKNDSKVTYRFELDGKFRTISAKFLTVHKAKGLEADIVIVINCNSGKFGFPSEMSDDLVLNLLLSEADHFENGEERRLFYVAMTRAKEKLFFVANSIYKSKFIMELEVESGETTLKKCPNCESADMVIRSRGTNRYGNYEMYGCSNFLYGCTNTEFVNT
jgi:DNA helicase-4